MRAWTPNSETRGILIYFYAEPKTGAVVTDFYVIGERRDAISANENETDEDVQCLYEMDGK